MILSEDKKLVGKMQDQEFEEFGRMHGYVIYKDSTVDLYYFMKEWDFREKQVAPGAAK